MIGRGTTHRADPGPAVGSRPATRRPVLVVQADAYNASRPATVLVAVITSNTALATMPGNVFLAATATGLPRDSVVNVTAPATLDRTDRTDRTDLAGPAGRVPASVLQDVDRGLRRALAV